MALLYGRAGRFTAKNGGFRPGQYAEVLGLLAQNTWNEDHLPCGIFYGCR
jgi:hypothetical protein